MTNATDNDWQRKNDKGMTPFDVLLCFMKQPKMADALKKDWTLN